MTDVVNDVEAAEESQEPSKTAAGVGPVDDQLVGMLVDRARSEGLQLTGEGGHAATHQALVCCGKARAAMRRPAFMTVLTRVPRCPCLPARFPFLPSSSARAGCGSTSP